jgi:hypothetical protein
VFFGVEHVGPFYREHGGLCESNSPLLQLREGNKPARAKSWVEINLNNGGG